jgi:hypothetical protein
MAGVSKGLPQRRAAGKLIGVDHTVGIAETLWSSAEWGAEPGDDGLPGEMSVSGRPEPQVRR